jgi:hypothetical protein
MPTPDRLGNALEQICAAMEAFEASESVANTGTGTRREGAAFEDLVSSMWTEFARLAEANGATRGSLSPVGSREYVRLTSGDRSIVVPAIRSSGLPGKPVNAQWLQVDFEVNDLVQKFPGPKHVVEQYAPDTGPYANSRYPEIYDGLTTRFDDTVVLVAAGVLHEKILLEYKTAKSSKGRQIDGNAHERLSFQVMQYLEVATRYTQCSLAVMANGAFVRYRNKYHVNFHVQADRLANFAWFTMDHACTKSEFEQFLLSLLRWLFEGKDRRS